MWRTNGRGFGLPAIVLRSRRVKFRRVLLLWVEPQFRHFSAILQRNIVAVYIRCALPCNHPNAHTQINPRIDFLYFAIFTADGNTFFLLYKNFCKITAVLGCESQQLVLQQTKIIYYNLGEDQQASATGSQSRI